MKRLPMVISLVVVLVAIVTGCGRTPRYDGRLTAADSLMRSNPDSALAIVEAVVPDSLASEGDRAYHDLLLTQARYRCYITATTDSAINRALAYYQRHSGEREKLTRAYIYKGAVMEELGHPDSAMLYYKHAEVNADPDDYFNLGYANLRIAELYQHQFSQDSAAIISLYDALQCFQTINNTHYLIVTLGTLGSISGIRCPDSTEVYLNQAIRLAQQHEPSMQYTYKSKLAGLYMSQEKYRQANEMAMDIFHHGREDCGENQYYFYAALSYVKLGLLDSALFVMHALPELKAPVDSMNYYNLMAEVAKANNDLKAYGDYTAISKDITTRITVSRKEQVLVKAEQDFNIQQIEKGHAESRERSLFLLLAILVSAIFILALLIRHIFRQRKRIKTDENTIRDVKNELETAFEDLQILRSRTDKISELVGYRFAALNELYQTIRIRVSDDGKTKKVIPLSSLFKDMHDDRSILKVNLSDTFWENMKLSVDGEFNHIVSFVEQNHPELNDKDIRLFCLLCAGLSPQIIRICMDYTHEKTASNKKAKLMQKMGLDMKFNEFIEAYMKNEIK